MQGLNGQALIGVATAAGMRFYDVALWMAPDGQPPRRIGPASERYRAALLKVGMGEGVGSAGNNIVFTNSSIHCDGSAPFLQEAWYVAGEQGLACWRLDGRGDAVSLLVFRSVVADSPESPGRRAQTLFRIAEGPSGRVSVSRAPSRFVGIGDVGIAAR